MTNAQIKSCIAEINTLAKAGKFSEASMEADRAALSLEFDCDAKSEKEARKFRELANRWGSRAEFEESHRA